MRRLRCERRAHRDMDIVREYIEKRGESEKREVRERWCDRS